MNIVETSLEWLVEHVCKVILKLLGSLKIEKYVGQPGQTIQLLNFEPVSPITKIIGRILNIEAHVATDSTNFGILLHVRPHFENCIFFWFESDVEQNAKLWFDQFAESLKKQKMRRQFSSILVFNTKEHILMVLVCLIFFLINTMLTHLNTCWIQYRFIFPRFKISTAQLVYFSQGLQQYLQS